MSGIFCSNQVNIVSVITRGSQFREPVNYFNEKAREKNREALSRITKHGVPYIVAYPVPESLASAINIGKSHAYNAVARFRKLGLIDKDNRHTELGKRVDEVGKYVLKANDQPH